LKYSLEIAKYRSRDVVLFGVSPFDDDFIFDKLAVSYYTVTVAP
jgi:hypothetical protein